MIPDLLVSCVPAKPDLDRIRACAGQVIDWNGILEAAERHAMAPLLHACLDEACPELVPEPVRSVLRIEARDCGHQSLRYTAELFRLLDAFERRGIRAIPFKGPALAWSRYRSPALRRMVDLDLLVAPDDVAAANQVLVELGYRPITDADPARFFTLSAQVTLRDGRGFEVDLHWHVTPFSQRWFDAASMMRRAAPIEVAGRTVLTFCSEDLLRFLCVHGAKHGWFSLRDVCDVARLIAGPVDIESVVEDARRYGGLPVILLGLSLARELGRAKLPADVLQEIARVHLVGQLLECANDHLSSTQDGFGDAGHFLRWQWRLLDGFRDRADLCWSVLQPTAGDWEWVRLHKSLYPTYYLIRPLRLATKYIMPRAGGLSASSTL